MRVGEIVAVGRWKGWWGGAAYCGLLLVLVLSVYGPRLGDPLGSDAKFLSYNNRMVREFWGIAEQWRSDFFAGAITASAHPYLSGYYRPVTNSAFWVMYRLAGNRDWAYNLTAVLLHWLTACAVLAFAYEITRGKLAALSAATLFAVHPINVFAATNPQALADVLTSLFFILSLLVYARAHSSPIAGGHMPGLFLALFLYALALLSKETGSTLPLVLLLYHGLLHYRDGVPWRYVTRTLPFWCVLPGYLAWRLVVIEIWPHDIGYLARHPVLVLYANVLKNVSIYVTRVLLPHGAEFPELAPSMVNFVDRELGDPLIYLSFSLVVVMFAIALVLRARVPTVAFLVAFFLAAMTPMLAVNNIAGTLDLDMILAQERWIYLPAIPIFLLLGLGLQKGWEHLGSSLLARTAAVLMITTVVVGLMRMAAVHAARTDSWFAMLRWYSILPENRLGRMNVVNKLMLYTNLVALPLGDLDEAEQRARRAHDLAPDSPFTAVTLAKVLAARGRWGEAVLLLRPWLNPTPEFLTRMLRTNPRVVDDLNRIGGEVAYLLGRALVRTGQMEDAAQAFCTALQRLYDQRAVEVAAAEVSRPLPCASSEAGKSESGGSGDNKRKLESVPAEEPSNE